MKNKFVPTVSAKSLYEVKPAFFQEIGVKVLLLDLDNTLASYKEEVASEITLSYLQKLIETGLKLFIISNNKPKRVEKYAKSLNLPFLASARKPLRSQIKKFLASHHVSLEEVMLVGDQLLTDVWGANRLGIKVLLVEKLVEADQWATRFNRIIDTIIRKKLRKQNKLKEWSTYGK